MRFHEGFVVRKGDLQDRGWHRSCCAAGSVPALARSRTGTTMAPWPFHGSGAGGEVQLELPLVQACRPAGGARPASRGRSLLPA